MFKGLRVVVFGWCSIIKPILHYLHSTSSSSDGQTNRQDGVKNDPHFD